MAKSRIEDSGWNEIKRKLKALEKKTVEVGILGTSALQAEEDDFRIVDVAIVNEFGTDDGHIPERPAHRQTYEAQKGEVKRKSDLAVQAIMQPGGSVTRQLNRLGLWYTGELKKSIIAFDSPANAPATIEKKGADNPLIDTGRMLNAIHHEIKGG